MSHVADYAWAPVFAILSSFHFSLLPEDMVSRLSSFEDERAFSAQAYYPPYDLVPRNISTWLSTNLTIGAESFEETVIGGPSTSQTSFNPAVIQWLVDGKDVGFISLYPTETALTAQVEPGRLSLTYPKGNSSSIFTFVVSTNKKQRTVIGWEDVAGLKVGVSGNVNLTYSLEFAGQYGGKGSLIRDFEFWNFTYSMPDGFKGVPNLILEVESE